MLQYTTTTPTPLTLLVLKPTEMQETLGTGLHWTRCSQACELPGCSWSPVIYFTNSKPRVAQLFLFAFGRFIKPANCQKVATQLSLDHRVSLSGTVSTIVSFSVITLCCVRAVPVSSSGRQSQADNLKETKELTQIWPSKNCEENDVVTHWNHR